MEFKDYVARIPGYQEVVDIGTEWNLKGLHADEAHAEKGVDIGTEWNLKIETVNEHGYEVALI